MNLHFLGRGAGFNVLEGNTSAYIREGEDLLLLDCGETVFERLMRDGVLLGVKRVVVAISHLHTDHVGSLGSLALYARYVLGHPLTVLLPDDEEYAMEIKTLLRLNGTQEEGVIYQRDEMLSSFAGVMRIGYVPTKHVDNIRCFSFILEGDEGVVFYSADTCITNTLMDFCATYEGKIQAIYMDACSKAGGVHLCVNDLYAVLPAHLREKTFLMHIDSPACIALGQNLGLKTVQIEMK